MVEFFQFAISGLALGAVYGLVALGFVLIFKSTDVFNFAQGDLLMVGGYTLFTAMSTFSLPLLPAIGITLVVAALLGAALQLVVFRPMIGQPLLPVVMVTIALALVIEAVVLIVYGPQEKTLPSMLPNEVVDVLGVRVSTLDLTVMAVAAVCVIVFALFFQRSKLGLQMRATAENGEAAAMLGIDSNRIFMVAFAIGTATAAIGGVLMANLQVVSPQLTALGLLAFPAAVIGGLTSIPGATVGGLCIGVIQQLAIGYVDARAANVFVYGVLLFVLLVRPYGLFGHPTVARV
jgi:branched-chain amino acid transport system permease protein